MKSILTIFIVCILTQSCKNIPTNSINLNAAQYNMQLGLIYLHNGEVTLAKHKLIKAITQSPRSANINSALAYFFEKTGDLGLAEKYYKNAISYSNKNGAEYNNYGAFLCRLGSYQKAKHYFMLAANDVNYANNAAAYENSGLCSILARDEMHAMQQFKYAIEHDPTRSRALNEIVRIELRKKNVRNVCRLLRKYPKALTDEFNLTELNMKLCSNGLVN